MLYLFCDPVSVCQDDMKDIVEGISVALRGCESDATVRAGRGGCARHGVAKLAETHVTSPREAPVPAPATH